MVLVDLAVNGSSGFLVALLDHILVGNGGSNLLVDSGVMMTSLVPTKYHQYECARSADESMLATWSNERQTRTVQL